MGYSRSKALRKAKISTLDFKEAVAGKTLGLASKYNVQKESSRFNIFFLERHKCWLSQWLDTHFKIYNLKI